MGWAFIGQDGWPSPYLARRTTVCDFELTFLDNLVAENHRLAVYLDKRRNIVQEYLASVWHGTSMAGLIVRNSKDIGLLAYRVVPPDENRKAEHNDALEIIETIIKACRKTIDDGADIIVMTSFLHFEREMHARVFSKAADAWEGLVRLVRSHPKVLFIASTGNDNGYMFGGNNADRIDLPTGIVAENLVVVGSLSEDGTISPFSNNSRGRIKAVMFHGENKPCIFPRRMLAIRERVLMTMLPLLDELLARNESFKSIADYLIHFGEKKSVANDGTAFAVALAANACARLWVDRVEDGSSTRIVEPIKRSKLNK